MRLESSGAGKNRRALTCLAVAEKVARALKRLYRNKGRISNLGCKSYRLPNVRFRRPYWQLPDRIGLRLHRVVASTLPAPYYEPVNLVIISDHEQRTAFSAEISIAFGGSQLSGVVPR